MINAHISKRLGRMSVLIPTTGMSAIPEHWTVPPARVHFLHLLTLIVAPASYRRLQIRLPIYVLPLCLLVQQRPGRRVLATTTPIYRGE